MKIQETPLTKEEKKILRRSFRLKNYAIIFLILPAFFLVLHLTESIIHQILSSGYNFMLIFSLGLLIFCCWGLLFFIKYFIPLYKQNYKNALAKKKLVITTRILATKISYRYELQGFGFNKFKRLIAIYDYTTEFGTSFNSSTLIIANRKNNLKNAAIIVGSTLEIHCLEEDFSGILSIKKV